MRSSVMVMIGVVLATGCGHAIGEAVRDGIDEATRRSNWEKLRVPVHDLAEEIAHAVIEAVPPAQLAAQLDAIVDRTVHTVLHALSDELDGEASPAIARTVRASVDAALASLLSSGTVHRVEEISDAIFTAAMTGLARGIRQQIAPALADALDASLGPAMQRAIQNNLGPAMAATLDHDFAPVLVKISRQTAAAAGEGLAEGIRSRAEPMIDRTIVRVQAVLDRAEQDAHSILAPVMVAILAALAGVLAVVLWLRHRAALAGRDAVHLMASELGRLAPEPAILELARRIKVSGEGTAGGQFLAKLLRSHPSIKVHPPSQPALIDEADRR
jgi:hypothetical protein